MCYFFHLELFYSLNCKMAAGNLIILPDMDFIFCNLGVAWGKGTYRHMQLSRAR